MNKKGQVTIFIIVAIIIVALFAGYFIFRDKISVSKIPASMEPVYTSFLSCLEEDTLVGIDILESQAGYISLPNFEPGSAYMPFSSQLNFLGNPIPYWYYVSGNNIQKEQVPSKRDMERELEDFIDTKVRNCIFDNYYEEGYEIYQGEPETKIDISENNIKVNLDMDLTLTKGDDSVLVKNHELTVESKLGALYDSALKIYEKEQEDLFLENYAVDVLRLYAPVDGVELTCSPQVWNADEVFDELQEAIEANTLALKTQGRSNDYFVVDAGVNEEVRFLNSKNWAHGFEVVPSEASLLIAQPVGNQPGLGILGFCYVPYHFVYNVRYPVLVQIYAGEEIFQFPVAIVIQGNKPREALEGTTIGAELPEICEYKNTLIKIDTYDTDLNRVEADISYECFGAICEIGKTSATESIEELFPQCVNGHIIAKAEGFEETRYLYSVVNSDTVNIVMDKLYRVNVDLKLDASSYNKDAIISFVSDEASKTVVYPQQRTVELGEGEYEIQVYIYENASLNLEAMTTEQCMEVPRTGVGGLFGLTKEQCLDVEIPAQIISNVLAGGGKETYYISEYELKDSTFIEINAGSLQLPESIEQLQENYMLFETKGLDITFR